MGNDDSKEKEEYKTPVKNIEIHWKGQIWISVLNPKQQFPLEVTSKYTIADLMEILSTKLQIDQNRQEIMLIHKGMAQIDHHHRLYDRNIKPNDSIFVTIKRIGPYAVSSYLEPKVYVHTLTGKVIAVDFHINDYVYDLKAKFNELEGIPIAQQRIIFKGKQLEDGMKLINYGAEKDSSFHLVLRLKQNKVINEPKIFVKRSTGKTYEIVVKPTDTIYGIKSWIQQNEGIPIARQRLIHAGKTLEDDRTLNNYNIKYGAELHLILRVQNPLQAKANPYKNV